MLLRTILHRNLECYIHESRQIGSGQIGDGKTDHRQFRNQWTKIDRMAEFNSDDHYISTTTGKNPLEELEWPSKLTKQSKTQYLCAVSETAEWSVSFQGKSFSITLIQVYAPATNAEEAEVEGLCEDLQDLLELIPKDVLFITEDCNAKVGSQEIPRVTDKFGVWVQGEAGQRLIEFCQENALVIANTLFQQHKRKLYTCTSPVVKTKIRLITFFAAKDGEALYNQQRNKTRSLLWLRSWTPYCLIQT